MGIWKIWESKWLNYLEGTTNWSTLGHMVHISSGPHKVGHKRDTISPAKVEMSKWLDWAENLTSDVFLGGEYEYAIHFSIGIRDYGKMGQWDLVLEILKWLDWAENLTGDVFLGVEFKYAIHFSIGIRD